MVRTAWIRQHVAALRTLIVLTVVLGLGYPVATWAVGQVVFHDKAQGSPVESDGHVVGSRLIGQNFTGPTWFHPRASLAGEKGYSAGGDGQDGSAGSNLGPSNPELVKAIKDRRAAVAKENGVAPSRVPPDAVTASASGLDPDISPAYAAIQVDRVAKARKVDPAKVRELVEKYTYGRQLGVMGDPHVNVLELNLAVAKLR
ncbi:MAG TPA: potassium-transporting ATPase subunit KdpC [Actinocatenispora sp.]